jgi:hypothetical protein
MKSVKCPKCQNPIEEKDIILSCLVNSLKQNGVIELEIGCPYCPADSAKVEINLPKNLDVYNES